MKLLKLASIAVLALAWPALAHAEDQLTGEQIYKTKGCMACHGKAGAKPILTYPAIAGQNGKYVLEQVNDIKSGKRVGAVDDSGHPSTQGMADILHILTDADVAAVAKYVSEQAPGKPKAIDPPATDADLKAGQDAYKKLGCPSCHGVDPKKANIPTYPILAGLNRDYLKRQMTEIRDGVRTNGQSKMMLAFIKKADDATILSMATYLSQIDRSAQ